MSDNKTNNISKDWQSYECKSDLKKILISDKLGNDCEYVYKYISLNNFLKSYCGDYMYFSDPNNWEDPFERKYQDVIEDDKNLNCYKVKAICFTTSSEEDEEASWKSYLGYGADVIRLKINFEDLCMELNKGRKGIYVTKMIYKKRQDILERKYVPFPKKEEKYEELFINNFSLKQDAYKYEKEVRLCYLYKKSYKSGKLKVKWDNIIEEIVLPPRKGNEDNIAMYTLLKRLLETKIRIRQSALYDVNSIKMVKDV